MRIKQNIFSVLIIVLLYSIKGYFKSNNSWLKKCLEELSFHPSIVNNPFIVFEHYRSILPTIYIHFYAKVVIKAFLLSIKKGYWNSENHFFLKFIGLQSAYIHDVNLMLDRTIRFPFREIEIPQKVDIQEKVVVYSVMIGDYDEILDPVYISNNCDYILFTDNINIKSKIWKIQLIEIDTSHSKKWNVCYYKMLAHHVLCRDYHYSIYVDAKVFICGDIKQLLNFIDDKCKLAMINHGDRTTILEEIDACVRLKSINKENALLQYEEYRSKGFFDNLGLVDTCILIREHQNHRIVEAMNVWFIEFDKYPMRDQLSIMYSIWKSGVNYKIIDGSVWSNQFSIVKRHKYR